MSGNQGAAGRIRRLQEEPEYRRRFLAQLLLATPMFGLAALVEVVVPLLSGLVWLARVDADSDGADGVWSLRSGIMRSRLQLVGLPALGAVLPGMVIARDRPPLLAWALLSVPRIAGSAVLAWSIDGAKGRTDRQPDGLGQPRQPGACPPPTEVIYASTRTAR